MFKGDGLFGKFDDPTRKETRPPAPPVNAAPAAPARAAPAEVPRAEPTSRSSGDTKGSKLIVGPDIKLKGAEITDCDTLVVEGRVEAAMDSRVIQIAQQGTFLGTAGIDVAEIHGRFEGELTVRKQLVIHTTGKVTGKVRYGKLSIEEGGELSGDVGTLAAGDAAQRKDHRPAIAKPALG